MTPTSGYFEQGGTRLWFETDGDGFPMALIHGFSLDRRF